MAKIKHGMGWLPDYPDFRDYTEETDEVREIWRSTGVMGRPGARKGKTKDIAAPLSAARSDKLKKFPGAVDLREWCSPVEDQRMLGSCTAHAGVGIIEYYERKAFGKHIDASRLFLYKVTRNLMKMKGDTGAYLRTTMGAMVLFGVPPEDYWPYSDDEKEFDREPPAFCYAFAHFYLSY